MFQSRCCILRVAIEPPEELGPVFEFGFHFCASFNLHEQLFRIALAFYLAGRDLSLAVTVGKGLASTLRLKVRDLCCFVI